MRVENLDFQEVPETITVCHIAIGDLVSIYLHYAWEICKIQKNNQKHMERITYSPEYYFNIVAAGLLSFFGWQLAFGVICSSLSSMAKS